MPDTEDDDIDDTLDEGTNDNADADDSDESDDDADEGSESDDADDSEESDESEEEGEEDADDEGEGKSGKDDAPASRKGNRIAALAKRAKEAEARALKAETLAEERARNNTAAPSGATAAEAARIREEKLALMTPEEQREYKRDEQLQSMSQNILLTQIKTEDAIDRNGYNMEARTNPIYSKHREAVEQRLNSERRQGRNWTRREILEKIIGERALMSKPNTGKKQEAKRRVEAVKGKSVPGRSNTSANRSGKGKESFEELENRLESVRF